MVFDRIVEAAKSADMSIADVEQAAGLGKNTIYNWKKTQPKAEMLMRVADVLGVSVDSLLGREQEATEDIWEVRERLRNQPGMRILFDATKHATAAELEAVANMFKAMKGERDE